MRRDRVSTASKIRHVKSHCFSVLNGVGENAVSGLTSSFSVSLLGASRLSELGPGFTSSLVFALAGVDVIESLSETLFDLHDLGGGLFQKVVNFGLDLGVSLPVVFLELDVRHSILDFLDEFSESLFSGLALIVDLKLLRFFSLNFLFLLQSGNSLLPHDNLPALLILPHLVDLHSHLIKLLVQIFDDILAIIFVKELNELFNDRIIEFIWKNGDRIFYGIRLEGF